MFTSTPQAIMIDSSLQNSVLNSASVMSVVAGGVLVERDLSGAQLPPHHAVHGEVERLFGREGHAGLDDGEDQQENGMVRMASSTTTPPSLSRRKRRSEPSADLEPDFRRR